VALDERTWEAVMSHRGFERAAEGDAKRAQQMRDALIAGTPVRRMGSAEDVAAAVAFLASRQAAFITGVTLPVDGGRSAALM